jgi:hypothetical protein
MELIQRYRLVFPVIADPIKHALAATAGEHDKIQVFQGTQAVKNYGITVQGSGAKAKGSIDGTLTTYDYKALYNVYTLKDSESANYWFVTYSKQTSHDTLVKTFESSQTLTTKYHVDFEIQGNDYGISSVFLTFEVIRLVLNGVSKDYVVSNPASSGANLSDGSPYPSIYKPITSGGMEVAA